MTFRARFIGDIGGGNGYLLKAVLNATPVLQGVLFDLPSIIEQNAGAASGRLKLHAGSFFEDGLPVCDACFLMQILHDWSDEEAERILTSIRRAAPENTTVPIAEFLAPEDGKPRWTLLVDPPPSGGQLPAAVSILTMSGNAEGGKAVEGERCGGGQLACEGDVSAAAGLNAGGEVGHYDGGWGTVTDSK